MPNWQPNWQDVRWNHGAAREAIAALQRTADFLDQTADERLRMAQQATEQWCGRYREEFDNQLTQMVRGAHDLSGQCRDTARRIANADQRAYEEQRRRERERERWRWEREAEERARQSMQGLW